MIANRNSKRNGRLRITALLIFCLFSTTLSDLYIHSAHAGHNHDAHDLAAVDMVIGDFIHAPGDDNSSEPQSPSNDQAPDAFSHGCLIFIVPSPMNCKELQIRKLKRAWSAHSLTARSPTRLDRPPIFVS